MKRLAAVLTLLPVLAWALPPSAASSAAKGLPTLQELQHGAQPFDVTETDAKNVCQQKLSTDLAESMNLRAALAASVRRINELQTEVEQLKPKGKPKEK